MDHARVLNIRRTVSGIIHTLIGVAVCWKIQIKPYISFDPNYGEIIFMYKAAKKTKDTRRYMEALVIHTGETTVHWEDNTSYISVVEAK